MGKSTKLGPSVTPGNKVGILRRRMDMTQEAMAEIMCVSRPTISAYENRTNANPSGEAITALSGRFGIPLEWFYDGLDEPLIGGRCPSGNDGALLKIAERLALLTSDAAEMREGESLPLYQRRMRNIVSAAMECLRCAEDALGYA